MGGLGGLGLRATMMLSEAGACGVRLCSRNGLVDRDTAASCRCISSLCTLTSSSADDALDVTPLLSTDCYVGVLHAATCFQCTMPGKAKGGPLTGPQALEMWAR